MNVLRRRQRWKCDRLSITTASPPLLSPQITGRCRFSAVYAPSHASDNWSAWEKKRALVSRKDANFVKSMYRQSLAPLSAGENSLLQAAPFEYRAARSNVREKGTSPSPLTETEPTSTSMESSSATHQAHSLCLPAR